MVRHTQITRILQSSRTHVMMDMSPGVNTVQSRRTLSGIVEQCKVISDDTCSES